MSTKYPILNKKEWLVEQYETNERSMKEIAQEIGCSNNTVRDALLRHGIETRGAPNRDGPINRELVVTMYEDGSKIKYIAEDANCSVSTIYSILDKNGVERRTHEYDRLHDREWLEEKLKENSQVEIARAIGCSQEAVSIAAKRHKLRV
jgi:Helix-turn-helix domain of resolvase.